MRWIDLSIQPFALPLIHDASHQGAYLCLRCDQGHTYLGEVSPLASLHQESLSSAIQAILEVKPKILGSEFSGLKESIDFLGRFSLPPSARFGLEMAMTPMPKDPIFYSAGLIHRLGEGPKREGVFKVKIDGQNPESQAYLKNILKAAPKAILRIDANQSFSSVKDFLEFFSFPYHETIEFIEEPFENPALLLNLPHGFPYPIALDESLFQGPYQKLLEAFVVKYLVLKPGRLGGYSKVETLVAEAKSNDCQWVLSSCYESLLGLHSLSQWAMLRNNPRAQGFGTYEFIKTHPFQNPPELALNQPMMMPSQAIEEGVLRLFEHSPNQGIE